MCVYFAEKFFHSSNVFFSSLVTRLENINLNTAKHPKYLITNLYALYNKQFNKF